MVSIFFFVFFYTYERANIQFGLSNINVIPFIMFAIKCQSQKQKFTYYVLCVLQKKNNNKKQNTSKGAADTSRKSAIVLDVMCTQSRKRGGVIFLFAK